MRQHITHSGYLRGGKFYVRNRAKLNATIAGWRNGECWLTIERASSRRSKAQNDYLHAVVIPLISSHTGYDPRETKELIKALHLPQDQAAAGENGILLNGYVIGGRTSTLGTLDFVEFLERVVRWAAEDLGVIIPDPDPEWRITAQRGTHATTVDPLAPSVR